MKLQKKEKKRLTMSNKCISSKVSLSQAMVSLVWIDLV